MPPRRKKNKKPRGSRGVSNSATTIDGASNNNNDSKDESYFDLMVLLPKKGVDSFVEMQLHIRNIMERLDKIGYTHMALTHTIYGRPRPDEDKAENAIPKTLWTNNNTSNNTTSQIGGRRGGEPTKKKQRIENTTAAGDTTDTTTTNPINNNNNNNTKIRVLRRLHVIIENLSDVSIFLSNSPCKDLLNGYDIVSVSPRNESTFQSVCSSAGGCIDIITLDYHQTRGIKLPYKIRPTDIEHAIQRQKAAFEIQYSPALLHQKQRKALIHTCRELQTAAYNTTGAIKNNLPILFSSGDRAYEDTDVGTMALRFPGDLINLMQVVCQFDSKTSINALKRTGISILKKAQERRFGKGETDVQIVTTESLLMKTKTDNNNVTAINTEASKNDIIPKPKPQEDENDTMNEQEDEDDGDGFIAM